MTDPVQETVVEETKPAKAPKVEQNGVSRPAAGTKTGRVWEIAETESHKLGKTVGRGVVLKIAAEEGINEATAATQYGKWCKFFGVKAVTEPKPVKVKEPKAPKEPKAKKTKEAAAAEPAAVVEPAASVE